MREKFGGVLGLFITQGIQIKSGITNHCTGFLFRNAWKKAVSSFVKEMMNMINMLAAPYIIETACCGLDIATEVNPAKSGGVPVASRFIDEIDFPDEIIYDIDGFHDGVTKPLEFIFRSKKRYHLRHLPILTIEYSEKAIGEIKTANSDEIVGFATHENDYDLTIIEKLFKYCKENKIQIRPVHKIMEDYLIINKRDSGRTRSTD